MRSAKEAANAAYGGPSKDPQRLALAANAGASMGLHEEIRRQRKQAELEREQRRLADLQRRFDSDD